MENRIAPPMEAIKRHYISTETTEEAFTKDLINFLNNPTVEKSKMPNAVHRFNLMPRMGYRESDLKEIAAYIFNTNLEKPGWFEQHFNEERAKYRLKNNTTPIDQGRQIAMNTKTVLGKNLMLAIQTKGTEKAISFCNTRAIPLTDSMAIAQQAKIKRVSDKNRNPKNAANDDELAYIELIKKRINNNQSPQPQIKNLGDKLIGYYPIMTNKMCLQCHGQPESEVLPNTLKRLKSLYPNDKALGYSENELRGIWVIEMGN
jgi:hypothetical protein